MSVRYEPSSASSSSASGQRASEYLDEPPRRGAVGGAVERVVLGHGQRAEARIGREDAQGGGGELERDAVAVGVLGERRVEEVDEVDVEVDGDCVASLEPPKCLQSGTRGVRAESVGIDDREAALFDRRLLERSAGLD